MPIGFQERGWQWYSRRITSIECRYAGGTVNQPDKVDISFLIDKGVKAL